jgi:putative transposase
MGRLIKALYLYFATAEERNLVQQLEFVIEENKILRGKLPKRITVTIQERRRLVQLGKRLGSVAKELISIVTPRTFARWLNGGTRRAKAPARKPGRPRTAQEIRELVIRIATESGSGAGRVLGELGNLGMRLWRATVASMMREHGLDPHPRRGEGTWNEFVRRHAQTLWACDFFSKKVWTLGGLVDVFVLFFIHVQTRRVHIVGMTSNPDNEWMMQQARNISMLWADEPTSPEYLIMDMDTKFTHEFRERLEADDLQVMRVGPRQPNMNAYAERFVQTIRPECLDHFICFGVEHLRHIVHEFDIFYNRERPHQGVGNRRLPDAAGESVPATITFPAGKVVCQERLGGLLKHYSRKAA